MDKADQQWDQIKCVALLIVFAAIVFFAVFAPKPPTFEERHGGKSRTEVAGQTVKEKLKEFKKGWDSK